MEKPILLKYLKNLARCRSGNHFVGSLKNYAENSNDE